MRGTKKLCHGCGKSVLRPVNSVCKECRALLRAGAAAAQPEKGPARLFRLTEEWPSFYSPETSTKGLTDAMGRLARAVMRRDGADPYGKSVSELPPSGGKVTYFSTYDEKASAWRGTARTTNALIWLDDEIRKALSEAFHAGKKDGQNLLMSIARGEVSINELTRASIEGSHD